MSKDLYQFTAKRNTGVDEALINYKNQVILVVNTASACGYTKQYEGLENLAKTYKDDFNILAFPCNQFGAQEPGNDQEIATFCQTHFGVSFPVFSKVDVNGDHAHPLWQWLTDAEGQNPEPIKWNFTKFLIGKDGKMIKRFEPAITPEEIEADIARLIEN